MVNNLRNSKKLRNILLLTLAGIIIIALNYADFGIQTRNFFLTVSSPAQTFFWNQGQSFNRWLGKAKTKYFLEEQNLNLELENQEIKAKLANLLELKKENEELKKALGMDLEKEFKLVLADIVSKDLFQDALIINKGSNDNVNKGMAVISPQKVLVGTIEEVFPDFSRIALASNKKVSFSVKIQNEEEINGVAKGAGNLKIIFDLIPQDKKMKEGDLVITTALGKVFPKGLLAGEISSLDYSDTKPFQTAIIKPGFDFKALNSVFVITNLKK